MAKCLLTVGGRKSDSKRFSYIQTLFLLILLLWPPLEVESSSKENLLENGGGSGSGEGIEANEHESGFVEEEEGVILKHVTSTQLPTTSTAAASGIEEEEGLTTVVPFGRKLAQQVDQLYEKTKEVLEEDRRNETVQGELLRTLLVKVDEMAVRMGKVEEQMSKLEEKLRSAESNGRSLEEYKQLHQQHKDEIRLLQDHHHVLNSSLHGFHEQISHITKMHNVTEHLKNTADLLLQQRWYEATLQWKFNEDHIIHGPNVDTSETLSDYLRQVIRFAYVHDGPMFPNGTSDAQRQAKISRLVPIFTFVHKLSYMEYKVFAYQTLIHQLLSDEIFEGTELFILAWHLRKNHGINSKGHRILPKITTELASGANFKLLFLAPSVSAFVTAADATEDQMEEDDYSEEALQQAGLGNAVELHIKGDSIVSKKKAHFSYNFPVYASKPKTYKPSESGNWAFVYRQNGYFAVKNSMNQGFLDVRNSTSADNVRRIEHLGTVGDLDTETYSVEFAVVLLDQHTFGIQCRKSGAPLKVIGCDGLVRFNGTNTCFGVDHGVVGMSNRRYWRGAQFALKDVYA